MSAVTFGTAPAIAARPTFTNYKVQSWEETSKFRKSEIIEDENGLADVEVMNDITYEVTATLVCLTGQTPPTVGSTLTTIDTPAVKWGVVDVQKPDNAGLSLLCRVSLRRSEGVTLS
jgi:hypothetical protein